jgi:hypothetical protein
LRRDATGGFLPLPDGVAWWANSRPTRWNSRARVMQAGAPVIAYQADHAVDAAGGPPTERSAAGFRPPERAAVGRWRGSRPGGTWGWSGGGPPGALFRGRVPIRPNWRTNRWRTRGRRRRWGVSCWAIRALQYFATAGVLLLRAAGVPAGMSEVRGRSADTPQGSPGGIGTRTRGCGCGPRSVAVDRPRRGRSGGAADGLGRVWGTSGSRWRGGGGWAKTPAPPGLLADGAIASVSAVALPPSARDRRVRRSGSVPPWGAIGRVWIQWYAVGRVGGPGWDRRG